MFYFALTSSAVHVKQLCAPSILINRLLIGSTESSGSTGQLYMHRGLAQIYQHPIILASTILYECYIVIINIYIYIYMNKKVYYILVDVIYFYV